MQKNTSSTFNPSHIFTPEGSCIVTEYSSVVSPEMNLWTEVILRAMYDIYHYLTSDSQIALNYIYARDARQWLLSCSKKPQSFLWCCEYVFSLPECSYLPEDFSKIVRSKFSFDLPSPQNTPSNDTISFAQTLVKGISLIKFRLPSGPILKSYKENNKEKESNSKHSPTSKHPLF